MHKAGEAARTVAALLDLATIAIEDAIAEIDVGARARFDQQHLVAANAAMAIGQEAQLLGCQFERLANPVEHDKVIAEAMHLGKCQFHRDSGFGSVHQQRSGHYKVVHDESLANIDAYRFADGEAMLAIRGDGGLIPLVDRQNQRRSNRAPGRGRNCPLDQPGAEAPALPSRVDVDLVELHLLPPRPIRRHDEKPASWPSTFELIPPQIPAYVNSSSKRCAW
jgi:hypothetical protein